MLILELADYRGDHKWQVRSEYILCHSSHVFVYLDCIAESFASEAGIQGRKK